MTKKAYKYYVIWVGYKTGVFEKSWNDISTYVIGYTGAKYKGYNNKFEAEKAFKDGLPQQE